MEEESLNEEELELFVERDLDLEQIAYRRRMLASSATGWSMAQYRASALPIK